MENFQLKFLGNPKTRYFRYSFFLKHGVFRLYPPIRCIYPRIAPVLAVNSPEPVRFLILLPVGARKMIQAKAWFGNYIQFEHDVTLLLVAAVFFHQG